MNWDWKDVSSSDLHRLLCIESLLGRHRYLLAELFETDRASLRASPTELLQALRSRSKGEVLLARAALDLWNGSGECSLDELFSSLDDKNLRNVLTSFARSRGIAVCLAAGCQAGWKQDQA